MKKIAIIGAGITGCTIARILAEKNTEVDIFEQRNHIAGNCFDEKEYGSYTHSYGPHLFHTNSLEVVSFLKRFTNFTPYYHKVLAYIDGAYVPLPFSLKSLDITHPSYIAKRVGQKLYSEYGYNCSVSIQKLLSSPDNDIKSLAEYVYDKVFCGYSKKQWGIKNPLELDSGVLNRIPIKISNNTDYFEDKYQYLPEDGYTNMISRMIKHPNINVCIGTKAIIKKRTDSTFEVNSKMYDYIFYSGMIDELFDYINGELPYRSLYFERKYREKNRHKGKALTINYPSHDEITRVTSFAYLSNIYNEKHTEEGIEFSEYPGQYSRHSVKYNIPYYPYFTKDNRDIYNRYHEMAKGYKNLVICGRLGTYKYLDMDDSVQIAIKLANSIRL